MKVNLILISLLATSFAADIRTVFQFPNPTWLENIAATQNGSLLVSVIGESEVHLIKPLVQPAEVSLVASFANRTSVLGITQLQDDIFAVAVGSTTPANAPVPETFAIWMINLSGKQDTKAVEKIADVPKLQLINGIAALNAHTILLADSWAGNIVALDTRTKKYDVVLEHPSLASNFSAALPIGVNGIKVHGKYVYYSNTVQSLLGRVLIDISTGKAKGSFTVFASGSAISVPDDFAVARDGSVYVARPLAAPQGDTLQHVTLSGEVTTIAVGGDVAGSTAVAFGRTKKDWNVVYLSTMGGFGGGGVSEAGGRVVAVALD